MRKYILTLLLGFTLTPLLGADYYWIGGTGSWTDLNHWATTSGGSAIHSSLPTGTDNVYFDANSFSATGQVVTLNADAFCYDMTWTGSLFTPELIGAQEINISGSLKTIADMHWSSTRDVNFIGTGNHTIDFDTNQIAHQIIFEATGSYTILSPIISSSNITLRGGNVSLTDSIYISNPIRALRIYEDSFVTNGNKIQTGFLSFSYSPSYDSIYVDLGTSEILLNGQVTSSAYVNGYWQFYLNHRKIKAFKADSCIFTLNGGTYNKFYFENRGTPLRVNNILAKPASIAMVLLTNCNVDSIIVDSASYITLGGTLGSLGGFSTDTINYISAYSSLSTGITLRAYPTLGTYKGFSFNGHIKRAVSNRLSIRYNSTPSFGYCNVNGNLISSGNSTFDSLIVIPPYDRCLFQISSGKTLIVNDSFSIASNGCFKAHVKSSSAGNTATISMPSGTSLETDFIDLQDVIATGGGTFNAGANSTDLGNNTGWTFTGTPYDLSLAYNYACISSTGATEVKALINGPASNIWWQETVAPYDTFNTGIDTVMASSQATYRFIHQYGSNCTVIDTIYINVRAFANGTSQVFHNNVGDEDWDNCSNWDIGYIPDSLSDVTIAAGDTVILSRDTAWCKDLTVNGVLLQTGGVLMVYGDIHNYGELKSTAGDLIIAGSGQDSITGSDTVHVNSLIIHKRGYMTFTNILKVNGYAEFIHGIFYTTNTGILHFASGSDNNKGADSSFVDGPVSYTGSSAISFPVGDSTIWAPIRITDPVIAGTQSTWRGQYFHRMPIDTGSYSNTIKKISHVEYWQLDKLNGTGTVRVSLAWKDDRRSGVSNHTLLKVMKYDGTSWQDMGRSGSGSTTPTGWVRSNYISTFSPFTFGTSNNLNYLPVEFLSVDAIWAGDNALVSWQTASEQHNEYFEIEYSSDNKEFVSVGTVRSKDYNSQAILSYNFNDKNAYNRNKSAAYYRIKQVDIDGKYSYSKTIVLGVKKSEKMIVFPNPNNGAFTIKTNGLIGALTVTDVAGKIVYSTKTTSSQNMTRVELNALRKGVYFVNLKTPTDFLYQRVILD